MKKTMLGVAASMLLVPFAAAKDATFIGEITDSWCAKSGSHAMMLKEEGMVDKDPNNPVLKKTCTQNCVKKGARYVLYDATKKITYELDDQHKPADFAGQQVNVTGTYDKATRTIHVTSIHGAY